MLAVLFFENGIATLARLQKITDTYETKIVSKILYLVDKIPNIKKETNTNTFRLERSVTFTGGTF